MEKVIAATAAGDAYDFPVVCEAIGHEDALYDFKGGFDRAGLTLGLKAGGYWPNNLEKRGNINHQSTVFLFEPDTGTAYAMVMGMAEADVVISITSAFAPSLMADHVSPGTHLACMGTDTKAEQEVEAALLAQATVFTDEVAQSVSIGEAQHAVAEGLIAESDVHEIGAVINGTHPGRSSEDENTLFDGTGVGLQDLAVAASVVDLAIEKGIAVEVDF